MHQGGSSSGRQHPHGTICPGFPARCTARILARPSYSTEGTIRLVGDGARRSPDTLTQASNSSADVRNLGPLRSLPPRF